MTVTGLAVVIVIVILLVIVIRLLAKIARLERALPEQLEEAKGAFRREFRKQSARTRVGNTVEQLVPWVKEFPYDPSDAFLLSRGPIDYVVFDGLTDGGEIRNLVFLDIKTGSAKTSDDQKRVEACARLRHVGFEVFEIDSTGRAQLKSSKRVDEVLESIDEENSNPPGFARVVAAEVAARWDRPGVRRGSTARVGGRGRRSRAMR